MDQRLFILARESAMKELLGASGASAVVKQYSGYATTAMILGWATGGIIFGMMSDRWGRVKTMVATLAGLFGFHRPVGLLAELVRFHDLSLSRRPRRRWHVRRGDDARGRERSGKCARGGARCAAGAVGDGQYRGLAHQPEDSAGGDGPSCGAIPAGGSSSSSAFCLRCWWCRSFSYSGNPSRGGARKKPRSPVRSGASVRRSSCSSPHAGGATALSA